MGSSVDWIAEKVAVNKGKGHDDVAVAEIIQEALNKEISDAGLVPIIDQSVCDQTLRNITALVAAEKSVSIYKSSVKKSKTRSAAEKSWRGSVSNVALIGHTHFVELQHPDIEMEKELRGLPAETRQMTEMVSKSLGDTPVYPLAPQLITSTDDTTEYVFDGSKPKEPKFVLCSKSSIADSGTNAIYCGDDCSSMNGLRVKLTYTVTAAGNCFPLVVTIAGLSEYEMPDDEFMHVEVEGLCIGGGESNPNNKQVGHVLFMRNTEGAEKQRFKWYQNNILIPGINNQRKVYFDYDGDGDIPVKLTACSWCDGDLSQIEAIKEDIQEFIKHNIIANKQNAARSGN